METISYPNLASSTMAELVEFYNAHSGLDAIKKFSTKAKAQEAVQLIIEKLEGGEDPEVEDLLEEAHEDATSLLSQLTAVSNGGQKSSSKNEGVWLNVRRILDESGGSKTNKEILSEIHELYGNTNTSYACIAWYRNKWKKDGSAGTSREEKLVLFAKAYGLSPEALAELRSI